MSRRKRDNKDSTGDPSKEKKSKEKVKEVKKGPPRKKYDCKMIDKDVEEYRTKRVCPSAISRRTVEWTS